jgi:hypothetical protein
MNCSTSAHLNERIQDRAKWNLVFPAESHLVATRLTQVISKQCMEAFSKAAKCHYTIFPNSSHKQIFHMSLDIRNPYDAKIILDATRDIMTCPQIKDFLTHVVQTKEKNSPKEEMVPAGIQIDHASFETYARTISHLVAENLKYQFGKNHGDLKSTVEPVEFRVHDHLMNGIHIELWLDTPSDQQELAIARKIDPVAATFLLMIALMITHHLSKDHVI